MCDAHIQSQLPEGLRQEDCLSVGVQGYIGNRVTPPSEKKWVENISRNMYNILKVNNVSYQKWSEARNHRKKKTYK